MHEYVKNNNTSRDQKTSQVPGDPPVVRVNRLGYQAPRHWLKEGLRDIRASGYRSLVYGVCFVLMGLGIDSAHGGNPAVALGLSAAFLFVGPFLSMGIYELSRQLQAGEPVDLLLSLFSWCRNPSAVGRFAFYLSAVMVLWLWLSAKLMEANGQDSIIVFLLASLVWASLAFCVLMASAVAIPMLLDLPVSAAQAVRSSVNCFIGNKAVLTLWFAIVAVSVAFSLSLNYWPLLFLGPWLGHATWHAYQQCLTRN